MIRALAVIFGLVCIALGIAGFMPKVSPEGMLLGIFHVNAAHNIIHLLTGIIALWTAFTSAKAARLYFQIFGFLYLIVGIAGFIYAPGNLLGVIANNMADAWLHTLLGILFIYIGFRRKQIVTNVQ